MRWPCQPGGTLISETTFEKSKPQPHLPVLLWLQCQLSGSGQQVLEGGLHLVAVGKQRLAAEDVEAQPGATHGHHQPPHIPEVTHGPAPHQGEQDVVVLLPLVLVHRLHLHLTSSITALDSSGDFLASCETYD
jgi:hypothetical protein